MALPGVTSIFKDRFYALSRSNTPIGPKVVVLGKRLTPYDYDGTATTTELADGTVSDVPDLDPYRLQDEQAVIRAFGYGSDIHRAFLELIAAGSAQITAVALPPSTTYTYSTGVVEADTDEFDEELAGESLWDSAFGAVEAADPDVVVLYGRGGHPTEWQSVATPNDEPDLGFYADNATTLNSSIAAKFADKLAGINNNTHPCLGVIGIKPFTGSNAQGMTPGQTASHLTLPNLINKEALPANGIHLVVVQGEVRPIGYPVEFGYANGACSFAGSLAQLDAKSSPTQKPLYNVDRVRYNASAATKEALIAKGITPVGLNLARTPIWVDARTFSKTGSDYERITAIRIVNDTINMVRQIAQRFVGEVASVENRNALETAITSGLRGMQIAGALMAADFIPTYDPTNNKVIIDLSLTPAFEIRNIEVRVAINLA